MKKFHLSFCYIYSAVNLNIIHFNARIFRLKIRNHMTYSKLQMPCLISGILGTSCQDYSVFSTAMVVLNMTSETYSNFKTQSPTTSCLLFKNSSISWSLSKIEQSRKKFKCIQIQRGIHLFRDWFSGDTDTMVIFVKHCLVI